LENVSHNNNAIQDNSEYQLKDINHPDDEIDIGELVSSLWRYKWSIVFFTIISTIISYYYSSTIQPIYTASAEVILKEEERPIDFGSFPVSALGAKNAIITEIEVAKSRTILETVVNRLGLTNDPEFNESLIERDPGFLEKRGYWPIVVRSFVPPDISIGKRPEKAAPVPAQILRRAVDALERKVSVANVRDTTILQITVSSWSAVKSAEIANAVSAEYLNARVQVKIDAQEFASQFIGDRVVEMREEVEFAEAEAQNFRSENAIVEEDNSEVLRFEATQNRVASIVSREENLRSRLTQFDNAIASGTRISEAARLLDDRRINILLSSGYTSSTENTIRKTVERLRSDVALVSQRRAALEDSLEVLERSLRDDAGKLVRYRQLVREAEATKLLFETFLARQKETAAQQGLIKPDARILTFAEPPYGRSRPRTSRIMGIGALLGLILGSLVALARRISENTFVTSEGLESETNLVVFGAIPNVSNLSRRSNILRYVLKKPNSMIAEAVRDLRTSIILSNVDKPPKVVLVTSSIPEEGKSITTILLGLTTAQMDRRSLVIDADLRRNTLHNTLKLNNEVGIISVLRGITPLSEAIHRDVHPNLDVLVVESHKGNAADLLSSNSFQEILRQAREEYDMIFLDAPPILAVTDARILAKYSDALIYVVRWNNTPKELVKKGIRTLNSSGIRVSGLVFGRIERNFGKNNYYYNKKYQKSIGRYYK